MKVGLAQVAAARIGRSRGSFGFGNARDVANYLERNIGAMRSRLGPELLMGYKSADDCRTLTRADVLGAKPDRLENSQAYNKLKKMIGLEKVKTFFENLYKLQIENFDRESKGEEAIPVSLSRMFIGNAGTGKSVVAQLYGEFLKELGLLSKGNFLKKTAADCTSGYIGGTSDKTSKLLNEAIGNVLLIDEAYCLDPHRIQSSTTMNTTISYGGEALDTIVQKLDGSAGQDMAVVIAGYKDVMLQMVNNVNANQGLKRRFQVQDAITFEDYSDEQLLAILIRNLKDANIKIEPEVAKRVIDKVSLTRREGNFGNAGTINNYLGSAYIKRSARITADKNASDYLVEDDFELGAESENGRDEFASLFNIPVINDFLNDTERSLNYGKIIEGKNPADLLNEMHMVFVGPPGTGKTSVAEKIAKYFHKLGVIPAPIFVSVIASELQAGHVGQTQSRVLDAMRRALGGVLFIDEAPYLAQGHGTFCGEICNILLGVTSEEFKGKLIVILAGYEDGMDKMFNTVDVGFRSRFNKNRLKFPAWNPKISTEFTVKILENDKKRITDAAKVAMLGAYEELCHLPEWGSARDIKDKIIPSLKKYRIDRLYNLLGPTTALTEEEKETVSNDPFTEVDVRYVFGEFRDILSNCQQQNSSNREQGTAFATGMACNRPVQESFPPAPLANVLTNSVAATIMNTDNVTGALPPNPPSFRESNDHKSIEIAEYESIAIDGNVILRVLEESIAELFYDPTTALDILRSKDYPEPLMDLMMKKSSIKIKQDIIRGIEHERLDLLKRFEELVAQMKKLEEEKKAIEKSEEDSRIQQEIQQEAKVQAKCKLMGLCPMNFIWLPITGGYQCAGGSHFLTNDQLSDE